MAMTWQDNLVQANSLMDFLLKGPARRVQARTEALTPMMRQLPTTVAAAIGPQITSNDPALQAQGQGLLAEYLRRNSPETRQGLESARLGDQTTRFNNQLKATAEQRAQAEAARQAQLFPGQLESQRLGIQGQRLQNQGQQLQNQRAALPPPVPTPGQQLTQVWEATAGVPMPKDFRAQMRFTPDGQPFVDAQPVEGTAAYNTALQSLRGGESAVKLIDDMLDDLATYGTEYTGAKALTMRQRRDRIVAEYSKLQALGVLQPADLARLDAVIPDPTGFGAQLNPWAASNMAAAYDQVRSQLVERLMQAREVAWFVPWDAITPEEQAAQMHKGGSGAR